MFGIAFWRILVNGRSKFSLLMTKILKFSICENMFMYPAESSCDKTIVNVTQCQQNYSYCYDYINHYWYPVPTWQNCYSSYNNFMMQFSSSNSSLPNYVPQISHCSQFQSYSNGYIDGCYRFRRGNRYCPTSHGYKATKDMSLRLWENLESQGDKPGFIFTLMSYNVLAQDLLEKHPYLYRQHDQKSLQWESRWKNVLAEIKKFNPDIICLQEVQESHINKYYSVLESLGYGGIFKKRTGIRTDGCSIYYKEDKLKLIDYIAVEFLRPEIPKLNRDNIGLIAKFAPRNHPVKEFVTATTHLLYNPRRNDVRLAQMQIFFAEIDKFSYQNKFGKPSHVPIIFTGDLNSQPYSELYQQITSGNINYIKFLQDIWQRHNEESQLISDPSDNNLTLNSLKQKFKEVAVSNVDAVISNKVQSFPNKECLTDNFSFRSVYDHGDPQNNEGTTFQDAWMTVDYIFYSIVKKRKMPGDKLKLLSRWRLPTREELTNVLIPNTVFGSDHLSLIAKFKLEF